MLRFLAVFHCLHHIRIMQKLLGFISFFIISCSNSNKKNVFYGYPILLSYTGSINNGKEQSMFEFYSQSGKSVSTGNYLDGFRNKQWYYNIEDSLIEVKWVHFKDKHLGFETNIFDFADTVFYGDYYTQIDYKMGDGSITMGVSVNNPLKDSLELLGYKKITYDEMKTMGYTINFFDSLSYGKIKIYSLSGINQKGNKIYINTAFGFIDNQHLQISLISTGNIKKQYNEIFFEGVLTNLYLKSKRFYFPFSSVNTD